MSQRGQDARNALVEAAERLFAERGIESVSLRDIAAAAGQRNHSAAQYHFGDRAGLLAAVYDNRMSEVNTRRHRMLDELEADGWSSDLKPLVEAAVRPLVEVVAETDGWYARFLVRTRWDAFAQQVIADVPVLSSFRRVVDLINTALNGGSAPHRAAHHFDRIDQMTTLFIGTIAGWEWRRQRGQSVPTADELCADLVATSHAVLTAHVFIPEPVRSSQ